MSIGEAEVNGFDAEAWVAETESAIAATTPSETREIERLREAAREIQQEADAHFRRGQPWVPGTDWLFEVMSRALTATPEDRNADS